MFPLTITHPGQPLPAPRPRLGRGHTYNDPAYTAYKQGMAWAMKAALHGAKPSRDLLTVKVIFYRQGQRKADVDNLIKGILDPGNRLIWVDDSQVREVLARVQYGSVTPRLVMSVFRMAT